MAKTKKSKAESKLLFEDPAWDFDVMKRTYDAIEDIALNDLGLNVYSNQLEIISSEQMLDAYSSIGMPLMYQHWSFGKNFLREQHLYQKGFRGLAYEIVINSNPCISYNMEENTMAMHTLVMAHAAFGHNHFFKNNYLFLQWTDADGILDYLEFAKKYIARCEERHGIEKVERVLDAAHALMDYGVDRYHRPPKLSARKVEELERERREYQEQTFNDLWRTVPEFDKDELSKKTKDAMKRRKQLHLPQENLLYFIEKFSPALKDWQREILHIVQNIAQYFYPQKQTKVMNEGCACFVHFYIVNELYNRGLLNQGTMLEIIHTHSDVLAQPDFDDPRFSGINPYALGFAMMQDIRRMCTDPTDEDRDWLPEIAGNEDWRSVLRHAWANYRDESFILQYLSPHLMRKFRMFALSDDAGEDHLTVEGIHNESGYLKVRECLAKSYDVSTNEPTIQVQDVDLLGDRQLYLDHTKHNGIPLDIKNRDAVLTHMRYLWGYNVSF